ncbi:TPA: hypothetical protein LY343_002739 [Enterococcus faecium]|nr:hypothetical protein [Enterococcus faecium]
MTEEQASQILIELKELNKNYSQELKRQSEERTIIEEQKLQQQKLDQQEKDRISKEKTLEQDSENKFRSDVLQKIEGLKIKSELEVKDTSMIELTDKMNQNLEKIIQINSTPDVKQETISNVSDLSVILVVWVILPAAIIYKLFVAWWERYF